MGLKETMKTVITPRSTRVAENDAVERELNALNSAETIVSEKLSQESRAESAVSPISAPDAAGSTKQDMSITDNNFSNFDFNVDKLALYEMRNMQKLSSNEVDAYADPRDLFYLTQDMYPADQVTFAPALLTLRDQAAACNSRDILDSFSFEHNSPTPIVGLVLRAHCSDLFKGSTKLRVKSRFVDVTCSIDDVKKPGTIAVLFAKPRRNVDIQTEIENDGVISTYVEYSDRDRTCFVDFPTLVKGNEMVVSGDNVWVEVFPIVGTSMLRKVVLCDIASHSMKLLPAQLLTLI